MTAPKASAAFAALIVLALPAGALLHATVPHHHGSSHAHGHLGEAGDVSVIWQGLHTAARHEDKKLALPAGILSLPLVSGEALATSAAIVAALALALRGTRRTDSLLEALRRGRVPYRKFG